MCNFAYLQMVLSELYETKIYLQLVTIANCTLTKVHIFTSNFCKVINEFR